MSFIVIGDSSLFHKILINTNKTNGVTAWYFWDGFDLTSHHEDGSLNVLDVKIVLGAWGVIRSHNSNFLSTLNLSGEDSTEGIESTFIISWHHLGDEDHKRTILVAILNSLTAWVFNGSFIQVGSSVFLGSNG